MKKEALLILLILTITLATAEPTLTLNKENFQPGETLLGEITTTGEFTKQIQLNDIEFYQGRRKTFFEYDLAFYNQTHYLWIDLNRQGNFTIKINNILYKDAETLKAKTIEKQLEIKSNPITIQEQQNISGNTTTINKTITKILSIKPGFLFTSKQPELIISNKGSSELNITYQDQSISLSPEDFQKVQFTPNQTFSYFKFSSYADFNIPIIYISLTTPETNQSSQQINLESSLRPNPSHLQLKVIAKNKTTSILELVNFAEKNLTIDSIESDMEILELTAPDSISAKSIYNLSLEFFSEEQGFFKGNLTLSFTEQDSDEAQLVIIPLEIYVFPEQTNLEELEEEIQTCEEIGGQYCIFDQECEGEETYAGGNCCIGTCKDKEPSSDGEGGWSWLWGTLILLGLLVVGFFVYRKIKKTKPKKPEQQIKEKSKLYEMKIKGQLDRV